MRSRVPLLAAAFLCCTAAGVDVSQCGKGKDCLFSPPGCLINNCTYFVSSKAADNWTTIELGTTNLSPNTDYIAVGFSDDDVMGDEAVTWCYLPADGSPPSVHVSFNRGKSNEPAPEDLSKSLEDHVVMLHAQRFENALYCTFRQRTSPSTQSDFLPSLDNDYILLVARGHAHNINKLGIHSLAASSPDFPFIAASPIFLSHEFTSTPPPPTLSGLPTTPLSPSSSPAASSEWLSSSVKSWLVQIHGILMLAAWLPLIPSGILAARYLRDHFASSTPGGLKWWFHIHRTLNRFGLVLALISTLLILLAKDFRWTGPAPWKSSERNTAPGPLHSLFGGISVMGAVVNVLLALCRCLPSSRGRVVFNLTHRSIGVISLLSALIAVFFAVNFFLKRWSSSQDALLFFVLYVGGLLVSVVVFEILERLKTRPTHHKEEMEMSGMNSLADSNVYRTRPLHQRPMYATSILFAVCVGGSCLLSVLLILRLIL